MLTKTGSKNAEGKGSKSGIIPFNPSHAIVEELVNNRRVFLLIVRAVYFTDCVRTEISIELQS